MTRRLAVVIAFPMLVLGAGFGLAGAYLIDKTVTAVNDRSLSAAARAMADALTVEDGRLMLDLPPAAFGMLENSARDSVFYSVIRDGKVITGYRDLPRPPVAELRDGESTIRDAHYRGRPVRLAIEARRLPGVRALVVIEVAETTQSRRDSSRQLMFGLLTLEIALIGVALLLLPLAMRWAMRPMIRLRDDMERRNVNHLAPIPDADTPGELRPLVGAFNALLYRLDQAMRHMRQFTADASHQMRTPLSVLRAHVSVLKTMGLNNPAKNQSLVDIDMATERLQRLLVQLLAMARAENAVLKGARGRMMALPGIVRQIASSHAPDAARRNMRLHFEDSDTAPASLLVDADLLTEILSNLIDNAIRYNDPGGTVWVRVRAEGDSVILEVEDDGPGIRPEDRKRVLERFTRLCNDEHRPGSGLGLSIASALAESLGARLWLLDRPAGRGLKVQLAWDREPDSVLTA